MTIQLTHHTYPAPGVGDYCSIPGCPGIPTYTTWVGAKWLYGQFTISLCAEHERQYRTEPYPGQQPP